MTKSQLVEKIREMPVTDQRDLAESILSSISVPAVSCEFSGIHKQMEDAAKEAIEYYRTDPDVALWQALDAEPIHE
ncbi:MAG: hypothetical protein EXS16_05290 [Gemmataceae bacterium]|nr:hypothetical protein [Gemmataceae bacterium]